MSKVLGNTLKRMLSIKENIADFLARKQVHLKPLSTYQYTACILIALIILSSYLYTSRTNHINKIREEQNWSLSQKCRTGSLAKNENKMKSTLYLPKIMHRIFGFWDDNIPEPWVVSLKSCMERENGFELMFWNKTKVTEFIAHHYPWFLSHFLNYKHEVQRADVARYFILYHYGGIYLDMDLKCKSNSTLTNLYQDLTSYKGGKFKDAVLLQTEPAGVTNMFMIAKQCGAFMRHTLTHLEAADHWYVVPYATVMFSTGPAFLSGSLHEFKSDHPFRSGIHLLDKKSFETYFSDSGKHGTWHEWDADIILYIYNVLFLKHFTAIVFVIVFIPVVLVLCSHLPYLVMKFKEYKE